MRKDATTNLLLIVIAIALIAIAIRPYLAPDPVHAQSGSPYPYLDRTRHSDAARTRWQPAGVQKSDRGHEGRKSLGLPHLQLWAYPVNGTDSKPRISHPFVRGTFVFDDTDK